MDELFQLILKSYGVIGLIVLFPYVLNFLMAKELKNLFDDYKALQNQRVQDIKDLVGQTAKIAGEQALLNKETNTALEKLNLVFSKK